MIISYSEKAETPEAVTEQKEEPIIEQKDEPVVEQKEERSTILKEIYGYNGDSIQTPKPPLLLVDIENLSHEPFENSDEIKVKTNSAKFDSTVTGKQRVFFL